MYTYIYIYTVDIISGVGVLPGGEDVRLSGLEGFFSR